MNTASMPTADNRLALLAFVNLAALPLYAGMPAAIILLILVLSAWQLLLIKTGRANPPKYILMLCVVAACAILFYSFRHLLGQQPGIALVIIMCVLKLFEINTNRDAYIVVYSACFVIASNFFYDQSVWLAIYVCALIVVMYSILVSLSDRLHTTRMTQRLRQSAVALIYSLPLMLILFVLFPRIPGPLWGLPEDAYKNQTGLSEEMSPGSINQLVSSSAIAFRVKFDDDRIPPHHERYWRGIVLTQYDGRTWRKDDAPESALANIEYSDPGSAASSYSYEVTLEPTNLDWLLALEYPHTFAGRYRLSREAALYSEDKINNIISYRIESRAGINRSLFAQEDLKYRLLPVGRNPGTADLASILMEEADYDARAYITAVLNYFSEQGFIYTLSPDLLGEDAMDDFLLQTRRGFCEHYASAFTYLMRLAGIPARVVIGYQGGVMNPLDDYMIVRQSDAHAWSEVWLDGRWRRIDPTATIAPDRIEQGITSAGLELNRLPALLVTEFGLLKDMAFLYDSFQNRWNQWVIGFDQERQKRLMQLLGFEQAGASLLVTLLTILLTVFSLLMAWLVLKGRNRSTDTIQYHYELLCSKLERKGFHRAVNEGPRDFESRILDNKDLSGHSRAELAFIFQAYRKMHYGNVRSAKLLAEYVKKVRRFRLRLQA